MDQWLGNLFYRRQPVDVLERMSFHSLAYWNEWHLVMYEAEKPKPNPEI